jgi:hypothetical protein
MPRVLYTACDIVPSPKGASTHILHNIRGLVNSHFDVYQVLRLLNDFDLSKRLADAATESALTKLTWQEAQKKLVKVYDRLLG